MPTCKPMLGLELTATPKTVGAKSSRFQECHLSLRPRRRDGRRLRQGAGGRHAEGLRSRNRSRPELERIKLEDGVQAHENVKLTLRNYAERTGEPLVTRSSWWSRRTRPTPKRSANSIESGELLRRRLQRPSDPGGFGATGEESDDAMAQAGRARTRRQDRNRHPREQAEGRLGRHQPLHHRAPARLRVRHLTEQTLGRGLRLPYGQRTGEEAIDTLTVIAHDRFDESSARPRSRAPSC